LGVVLKHGDLRFEREDEAGKEQRSMIWFGFFLQTQIAARHPLSETSLAQDLKT
jgi:hypothetical protein